MNQKLRPIKITVVMPTYNRPHIAERAFYSVIKNISQADEFLIINDGSSVDYGDIKKLCSNYENVRYYKIENVGVSGARNFGIDNAKNNLVAFIDDDDEWLEGHLIRHKKVFEKYSDLAAVFSNFINGPRHDSLRPNGIDSWSQHTTNIRNIIKSKDQASGFKVYIGDMYQSQLKADYICPSSLTVNKEVIGSVRYRVGLKRNETWLFSSTCCQKGEVAFVDESDVIQHPGAELRGTSISFMETVFSRIYVICELWGRDADYLRSNKDEYLDVLFNEFYLVFRHVIARREFDVFKHTVKTIGLVQSLKFCVRSVVDILKRKKPIYRLA